MWYLNIKDSRSTPRCARCVQLKVKCSLSPTFAKKTKATPDDIRMAKLYFVVIEDRLKAGLAIPSSPADALQMLEGRHPDQTRKVTEEGAIGLVTAAGEEEDSAQAHDKRLKGDASVKRSKLVRGDNTAGKDEDSAQVHKADTISRPRKRAVNSNHGESNKRLKRDVSVKQSKAVTEKEERGEDDGSRRVTRSAIRSSVNKPRVRSSSAPTSDGTDMEVGTVAGAVAVETGEDVMGTIDEAQDAGSEQQRKSNSLAGTRACVLSC